MPLPRKLEQRLQRRRVRRNGRIEVEALRVLYNFLRGEAGRVEGRMG